MTVESSHGKRRPRVPRPGEHALVLASVLAGPYKDPATGRWVKGTQASRLRGLKTVGNLITMNPEACAPWVRPYVEMAQSDASALVVEVGAESSPSLMAFAEDAATAGSLHRAFLAIALDPATDADTKASALTESRLWLKERRQSILSLRGEARARVPEREDEYDRDLAARQVEFQRTLAERTKENIK